MSKSNLDPYIDCPACGSRSLTWHYADTKRTEGATYHLDCDTCDKTVRIIACKEVAEFLNALQSLGKLPRKKQNRTVDPATLDWSKSTRELAKQHDVSHGFIWMYRRKFAPETIPNSKKNIEVDWSKVDWEQSTSKIMQTLRCSFHTVNKMRAIHAPGTPSPETIARANQLRKEKLRARLAQRKQQRLKCFDGVDWSLPTKEIARLTGRSRHVVSQVRAAIASKTVKRRKKLPPDVDWSLSDEELASKHDVALVTVYRGRLKHTGRKPRHYKRQLSTKD